MTIATPGFFRTIARYAAGLRAAHAEIRTERMVSEMPAHLRKDIGWPDAYPHRSKR
jgi:hypothetical protein